MINASVLSSDKIRKELFPIPTYSTAELKMVYDAMIVIAKYLNDINENCILDATFNREESRIEVKKKLGLEDRQFQIIECLCPDGIAISRLESRKDDYSDATVQVYQKMKDMREPVKVDHITVDTTQSIEENISKIAVYISKKLNKNSG